MLSGPSHPGAPTDVFSDNMPGRTGYPLGARATAICRSTEDTPCPGPGGAAPWSPQGQPWLCLHLTRGSNGGRNALGAKALGVHTQRGLRALTVISSCPVSSSGSLGLNSVLVSGNLDTDCQLRRCTRVPRKRPPAVHGNHVESPVRRKSSSHGFGRRQDPARVDGGAG